MQDLSVSFFFSLVLFLAFPFVFGFLASKVKLPALLGYVVGGVVLGVFLKQDGVDVLSQFAQIGVILLLFTIGLEVDLSRIRRFSRFVFVGGAIQIGITTVLLALLSLLFGLGFMPALLIGLALSLSSTAVVAKIIQDRGEEHSLLGELAIGLLIFQDIAAIPILILTSALGKGSDSSFFVVDLLVSLLRSMVVIGLLYFPFSKFHQVLLLLSQGCWLGLPSSTITFSRAFAPFEIFLPYFFSCIWGRLLIFPHF